MEHFIDWLLRQNIELTILVCLVLMVRVAFKKVLAPKAIHLLWLIVLVKSVTYMNVPYVSTKHVDAKSEINNISNATNLKLEKSNKNEIQPSVLLENEKPLIENIKIVTPKNENVVKKEATPSLFVSIANSFTADKIKLILLWSYILILTMLLIHLLISLIRVRKLKIGGTQNDLLTKKLQSLKVKLKIKSKIEIVESNLIPSPTLIGIHSFTILIPANILGNISHANLEDIITHELMHIKRKDTLVNLIYRFVACLYFYNPFIWLAYFTMKKDMESACDQDVLIKSDFKNNISYAESLLLITKLCKQNGQVNHHAMMFIHKNTFKRIDMITNIKKPGLLSRVVFTATIIFALIVFVPSYRVVSEEKINNSDFDNKTIKIDNKDHEDADLFIFKTLKNTLGVKNVFNLNQKYLFNQDFIFTGNFKQFKELVLKKKELNVFKYNESLYFVSSTEEYFLKKMEKLNNLKDVDPALKNLLNKKIKNIAFPSTDYMEIMYIVAKEVGFDIDVTTKSSYWTLKRLKDSLIKAPDSYSDISAWEILVSISCQFGFSFDIEFMDKNVFLCDNKEWHNKYIAVLQKNVVFDTNEFILSDFIQTCRNREPELQIILQKSGMDAIGVNGATSIKLLRKQGVLGEILKEVLNPIKMEYQISDGALVITAIENIEKEKLTEEFNKKLFLTANDIGIRKKVDIEKLLNQPVKFDFTDTLLKDGLEELSNLTGLNFVYEDDVINDQNNDYIRMVANGMSVRNALNWILANAALTFSPYKENSIMIRKTKLIKIPATFIEIGNMISKPEIKEQVKKEKFLIVKTKSEFRIELKNIDKIQINNEELRMRSAFEIVSVESNYILVKIIAGEVLPETACTIFYRD